jgi:hypothetical protein
MTEQEWLACTDPQRMLEFLKGKTSDRKLRLFACGCCRLIWDSLTADRIRRGIEMAEQYGDGQIADPDLERAYSLARQSAFRYQEIVTRSRLMNRDSTLQERRLLFATEVAYVHKPFLVGRLSWIRHDERLHSLGPDLLRCIYGLTPFRRHTLDPHCLSWSDELVVRLAQSAYEERHLPAGILDNRRLTVLADALEEAGCTDAEILSHLRRSGPHVRGCWPVDLLLGKS